MDTTLWKARIKPGKQPLIKEQIDFLRANKEEGGKTLKDGKEHLEAYFTRQENEAAYLYLLVLADDPEYASQVA